MPEFLPKTPFIHSISPNSFQSKLDRVIWRVKMLSHNNRRAVAGIEKESFLMWHAQRQANIFGQQLIGLGHESVVVPMDEEKVAAISHKKITSEEARRQFYTHRILNILFPHNFPRFYAAFGSNAQPADDYPTGTIRQKIERSDREIVYPFGKVDSIIENILHLPISVDVWGPKNFAIGTDGGQYYLDVAFPEPSGSWNLAQIISYMEAHEYSEQDQLAVSKSIKKLINA